MVDTHFCCVFTFYCVLWLFTMASFYFIHELLFTSERIWLRIMFKYSCRWLTKISFVSINLFLQMLVFCLSTTNCEKISWYIFLKYFLLASSCHICKVSTFYINWQQDTFDWWSSIFARLRYFRLPLWLVAPGE